MPATSVLQTLASARYCYLLLIDGIEYGFTDDAILTATTFTGADGHTIVLALDTRDLELEESLNPRSGQPERDTATFRLIDFHQTGLLPGLFRASSDDETDLAVSVYPSDDLSSRTELHDQYVGTERIGSSGARHRFPCVSGFNVGDMHVGFDQELPHHRPAPVSSGPKLWRGRRCCLYRCFIDLDGTRRPYSEAQRIWWGTITDQGFVNGREWSIEAEGWGSWLRKEIGVLTQSDPVYALGSVDLNTGTGTDESRIAVYLFRRGTNDSIHSEVYGIRNFTASITGNNPLDIIADISTELATASATVGADGAFEDADNRWVSIDSTGKIGIHTDIATGGPPPPRTEVGLYLTMHAKVWAAIGYSPVDQSHADVGSKYWVDFNYYNDDGDGELGNLGATNGDAPGSGYITGAFLSRDRDDQLNGENNENPRYYFPYYSGGTSYLSAGLNNGNGQIVDLGDGFASEIIYHRGQLSRPIASDPADPTAPYPIGAGANRQGLWLFFGKRRFGNNEFDEYQVARASWRSGTVGQQGQVVSAQIVVTEWLRPRSFGFDRPMLSSDWVTRANADEEYRIKAVPILALDYRAADARERADVVIQRLLRSTGTSAGWSGYANEAGITLDGGDNDGAGIVRQDAEVADLGLAIPDEMVANVLAFATVYAGLPSTLGDVKVAFSPGTATEDILESLTRPFGLSWTLRGGVYGVDDAFRTPAPIDIDVVLTTTNKLGEMRPDRELQTGQELRAFAPIDRFDIEFDWAPHENKYRQKYSTQSTDPGRRYRHGGVPETHKAMGMRDLAGWATRARQIGAWWAQRHFLLLDWPYMGREPRHVGEYCRITDPRGVNPEGTYGITAMIGRIIGVRTNARPNNGQPHASLTILVYANTATTPRLHAMSARAFGIDTDNDRIYVRNNWLGFYDAVWAGDGTYFAEPTLAGLDALGGDLEIVIVQWDGQWRTPITGRQVTAVGSDNVGTYLELDSAPSEYYHRMDTIVIAAPRGTLAAQWALDYYGVTCADDGQFGATNGFRWEDL